MKKLTKKQAKIYFKEFQKIESEFYGKIVKLEEEMTHNTGIIDIEFFFCDNEMVGIGNKSRTMKLIHRN